jgi:hypothetical protein
LQYTDALSKAVSSANTKDFKNAFDKFYNERKKLMSLLKPADYRYISFQLWQEGIARYTEYKFLQLLDDYTPTIEVSHSRFYSIQEIQRRVPRSHLSSVTALTLDREKRVCFYDIGLAEGILLDKLNPQWRSQYLTQKIFLEKYTTRFDAAHK